MICLIASSYLFARKWAQSQHLRDEEWFYPNTVSELYNKAPYHVITVVDGIEHMTNNYLNMLLTVAWRESKKK